MPNTIASKSGAPSPLPARSTPRQLTTPPEEIRLRMDQADGLEGARRWLEHAAACAREASQILAQSSPQDRDDALRRMASAIRDNTHTILAANARDIEQYHGSAAFRDRLLLNDERVEALACGLLEIADQPDPLNRVLDSWTRPNGLLIQRVTSPIGVIGMIYESRPNVGVDAAGLALKSGNAVILRGGSDSHRTAQTIQNLLSDVLEKQGLPRPSVQSAPSTDRAVVAAMLEASGKIDLLIPRGSKSLVERVQREARVPVLAHAEGICHTYIHEAAEPGAAIAVLANAKMRRPGVCSATETLLIDARIAGQLLPRVVAELGVLGCRFVGDGRAQSIDRAIGPAEERDFRREWQDAVLSIAVVDGLDDAVAHIRRFGSGHTDAILTEDAAVAEDFLGRVDSAVTLWNASTQFSDGGEFGFGAEIGISTGRLHARGPIGAAQLVTTRYQVRGSGQLRP